MEEYPIAVPISSMLFGDIIFCKSKNQLSYFRMQQWEHDCTAILFHILRSLPSEEELMGCIVLHSHNGYRILSYNYPIVLFCANWMFCISVRKYGFRHFCYKNR